MFEDNDFTIVGVDESATESFARKPVTYWGDAMRRFRQNKVAVFAFFLLCAMILMTIVVPMVSPYDYSKQDLPSRKQWPSAAHWFGTDDLGRDLFTRVWQGGRVSIAIGVIGSFAVAVIGCIYGGIAAYFGPEPAGRHNALDRPRQQQHPHPSLRNDDNRLVPHRQAGALSDASDKPL